MPVVLYVILAVMVFGLVLMTVTENQGPQRRR
jgi:hypothetical protein